MIDVLDPRKASIFRDRLLTARPVRPMVYGWVPLWEIAKVSNPVIAQAVWSCARQAAYLDGCDECHCEPQEFFDLVAKWKECEMFGGPAIILVDLLVETIKTMKYEIIVFTSPTANE